MMYMRRDKTQGNKTSRPAHLNRTGCLTAALAALILATPLRPLQAESPTSPTPSPSDQPGQIEISPEAPSSGWTPPTEAAPPEAPQAMPEDPYWQETVERAVEQFESDNPAIRRSAVMLLGKYPVPPARDVVGRALEDPDKSVRQAALVSVLEEPGQIYPPFVNKMLRLLADPDVAIRRIASNSVRTIVHSFPFRFQPGAQMRQQLSDEAQQILQNAFRDEDVSVRRNMVTHYPLLRIELPQETVVALLHDSDHEVAVHALRWGLSLLSPAALADEVAEMVEHESDVFRLELARALQSHRSPDVLHALEHLQHDSHPPVAIEAMLATFNHRQSVSLYDRMMELYRESGMRGDIGQRLIFAAQMLGDQGEPFLREWLKDNNPSNRQQASRIYLNRFGQEAEFDLLLTLLTDSVQQVRQQASRTLIQSNRELSETELREVTSIRYADVRQAATQLAEHLPADQAEDFLLDLLLDEVRDVRLAALQQIGVLQIPGWEEIMSISLHVDDPLTSRTALDWLIRNSNPGILELLQTHLDENPQSPHRQRIEAHLQRHQTSGPS